MNSQAQLPVHIQLIQAGASAWIHPCSGLSQPPIDDIETYWTPAEKAQAMRMLARSIVGSQQTIRAGIAALVQETGADELIVVSDIYDHPTRLKSFEMIMEAAR